MRILTVGQTEKIQTLRNNRYFSTLDLDFLESLASHTSLRSYKRGEIIFWQGDPCAGLYIIRQGSVKLFKLAPNGRELIMNVYEEGDSFNEVPVFDEGKNPINVATLEDSEIWLVEAQAIQRLVNEKPELAHAVIRNLCSNLRMLVGIVEELSLLQVTNRLARLLSRLPQEQLDGPAAQRLTQDQLAARLGTVREVVARSLRELERSGAIQVAGRRISVMDERILEDWF